MAVTDQQKLDFLLKKIGFTKTKTGSVVGTGAISGTGKQPFAEAIPSPLIIANSALWNESDSIPTTPPGSDTSQVKVYLAGTSGLRMTADSTSSGQRAYIAYTTYNDASSTRLTNWIDTQFGASYLIKVYKGDPNSGGVALSAAGSGSNDGWFFDYSAGTLNFNDTSVPSGVTDTNIYIVGYRYIGLTGAPTATGGGDFTYNDLIVSRNLSVGGLSTFTGDAKFVGNVSIGGTLTYEDVINVDSVGLITARAGINVTGGVITALAGENKIPSLYANMGALPSAGSYHGMFAHVHATARGYFAHAGNWLELVNKETNGVVGTGTETYNVGNLVSVSSTATSFNVTGVTTVVTLDVNGDIDVDGHTNLDNVNVAGVSTFAGAIDLNADLDVDGHLNVDNVSIAGVTTLTGAVTANGAIDLNADLDVDGHTNLDNVSIAGVSTFASAIDLNADLDVDGHTNLDNVNVSGVTTFAGTVNTASIVATGIDLNGDIDVDGHTNLDNVSVAGVTTFAANARFNSTITAGGATGSNGQYLKTTGTGVEWASFPTMRTNQTFTASAGQTTFSFSYTVGFLDVFVNGVKLSTSEFTATNGSSVVLAVGCFVGDIVELISYYTVSGGGGGGGGISNVVEDTTPQLGGNLDLFNKNITGTGNISITGSVTATNLIGDGSGLTNVVGSGSGVIVKNSGSTVGTAGTIDFGDNLSVSPASAGIVTITGSAGVSTSQFDVNKLDVSGISTFKGAVDINADIDVDGHTNLDNVSISGVVTATTFVGAVTGNVTGNATGLSGNPSINITDLDVDGHTNLDNVSVAGVTTFTGAISASDIRSNSLNLKNAAGSATYAIFTNGGSALLKHNNTDRLETTNAGVTVTGTVSATAFSGDGSALTGISAGSTSEVRANTLVVTGVSTLTNIDVDDFISVGSNIHLGNAGVVTATTFVGALTGNSDTFTVTANNSTNETVYPVFVDGATGSQGAETDTGLNYNPSTGALSSLKFIGDGSGLTGVTGSGTGIAIKNSGSVVGTAGTINFGDNLSVSAISGGSVTVTATSGISTISGVVNIVNDLDVDGHTNLDNVSVAGVSTFAGDVVISSTGPKISLNDTNNNPDYDILNTDGTFQVNDTTNGSVRFRINSGGRVDILQNLDVGSNIKLGNAGVVTATSFVGDGSNLTGVTPAIGITTNLSGSFTASAGSAATINTLTGYSANDLVVEYTIYIKNGSDFQSQKLLAMRDGTTIHSTQFAVMFSSSLLVQCDATISSGNILLRATPETGVSGSTTYKIKREVM
nr:hypothetical protein [uncultured Mediterranean phage uvMED]